VKRNPTRPDLLARLDALIGRGAVKSGHAFERDHKLVRNCVAKFRQGTSGRSGATQTVLDFEAALDKVEGADARVRLLGPDAPVPPPNPAPPGVKPPEGVAVPRAPGRPRATVEQDVLAELLPKIQKADTTDKKDALLRYVLELAAKSEISGELARFFNDSIGQQRQLAKVARDEAELARAGEPLKVVIEYVNDWRSETGGEKGERE
jgi:hypothetical protein